MVETEEKKVVNITQKKRILWLDGMKGFACLVLFFSHFFMTVYPRIHFGYEVPAHSSWFDDFMYLLPFKGWVFVGLFCITSGMMLSMQVMRSAASADKLKNTGSLMVKRYLRLVVPMIPVAIVVWIFLKAGLFYNLDVAKITESEWLTKHYKAPMSITGVVSSVLVKTWFYGDDSLSTAFWMMYQMFYGSIMSIILGMVYWVAKRKSAIIYLFTFLVMLPRHDYIAGFALGALLAQFYMEGTIDRIKDSITAKSKALPSVLGILMVIAGCVMGSYPGDTEVIGFYKYMETDYFELYYSFGAFLLIVGVWLSGILQKFFEQKVMVFLGKISYELFLVHIPILFSVGMWMWLVMYNVGVEYNLASFIMFVVTTAIVIFVSWLYSKYVSKWCGVVIDKVSGWLLG